MSQFVGIFLLLIALTGCSHRAEQEGYLSTLLDKIEEKNSHKDWKIAGYIGIMKKTDLQKLQISYNVERAPTLEEARDLLVEGALQLLAADDLKEFSYKDLKYSLAFKKPDGKFVGEKAIAHAYLFNGIIYYSVLDKRGVGLEVCSEEPFLEAQSRVAPESLGTKIVDQEGEPEVEKVGR